MKKRISLVYVKYTRLQGDEIIHDCAKFLLEKICTKLGIEIETTSYGILPENNSFKILNKRQRKMNVFWNCFKYKFQSKFLKDSFLDKIISNIDFFVSALTWIRHCKQDEDLKIYYESIAKNSDLIFFCGGGIFQQSYMRVWAGILAIIDVAKKYKVPVYFNAVGIQKAKIFAENFLYSFIFNSSIVKKVTFRENIGFAKKLFINKTKCSKVLDSGMWADECYNTQKAETKIVGIGLIRSKIFHDMGWNVTEEEFLNCYIGIIKELEARGYTWQLFVNGNKSDYMFGEQILEKLNKDYSYYAHNPQTPKEFMEVIKNYQGIIAARLHSNIVATSLKIPNVGIVWNNKLLDFASEMNFNWNYITPENFSDSKYIVDQYEKAISEKINQNHINNLKQQTLNSLERNLKKIF